LTCKGKLIKTNRRTGEKTYEKCSDIGMTDRILKRRIDEHKKKGSVFEHTKTGHEIDFENVKVIDSANTSYKLALKESMHITLNKPTLNVQQSAASKADPSLYVPHNVNLFILRCNG
jgi:hypothetical protein